MAGAVAVVVVLGALPAAAAESPQPPVRIVTEPSSQTVTAGADVSFEAQALDVADADVPVLRWDVQPEGGSWAPVSQSEGDATLLVEDVTATVDGSSYRAVFDDGLGGTIATTPAVLSVQYAPVFVTQPVGATVAPGGAFKLTVAVQARPAATVVWQVADGSSGPWTVTETTGTTFSGSVSTSPKVTRWYRAVATNMIGQVASQVVAVTSSQLAPKAVSSLQVTNPKPTTITASWKAPADGGPVSTYSVTLKRSSTVVTTKSIKGTSITLTAPAGTYTLVVRAVGPGGEGPVRSAGVTVRKLTQTLTFSAWSFYPFPDGYRDSVTFKASSTYAQAGAINVVDSKGATVRTLKLASAKSWSVKFDGRTSSGRALTPGTYKVRLYLDGVAVADKQLKALATDAKPTSAAWSVTTLYPVRDGYVDTAQLTVSSSLPATAQITITKVGSTKAVASATLARAQSWNYRWTGLVGSTPAPAGTYRATIVVKGGDGPARTTTRDIVVSAKKITATASTYRIDAADAATAVLSGNPYDVDGSAWFYSSPYESDIAAFAAKLDASFQNKYSGLTLYGCLDSPVSDNQVAAILFDEYGDLAEGFAMGDSGCAGVSFPAAYVLDGWVEWIAGNASENYDYGIIDYWKISYTRYVLK
ncbi:fibronectin type III domain-containing protein [Cellulomonas composti]|uniref:Fibronectin type-III domain-containing protein n=1 Tax=Cellulomonas composti TaxID=266130 RepID=A0A511JA79_9CELL|nr:FlgD immunoglobulin-like domain containing protein [Cellulomonas composti]GEL94890.1 hypothetical protein CCO02nite_15480 [Cellulomonas composti]